jgi:hypothetical protein
MVGTPNNVYHSGPLNVILQNSLDFIFKGPILLVCITWYIIMQRTLLSPLSLAQKDSRHFKQGLKTVVFIRL